MSSTWIFQGNPSVFDIDGYLGSATANVLWSVNQYAKDIAVGDTVFLWRSSGEGDAPAGVIAEAVVEAPVVEQPDDPRSKPF